MDQPIVLCGLGRIGWRVLEYLQAAGLPVVVIDTRCSPAEPRLRGTRLIQGDCRKREHLEEAGVAHARGVLILTADDLLNITTTLTVRAINSEVRIVLRMFNQNLLARLGKAVKNIFALSTSLLTAPVLAITALTGQALGAFRIDGLPEGRRQVAEISVGASSPWRGQRIVRLIEAQGVLPVAHFPSSGAPRYLLDVDPEAVLEAGDALVLCGEPRTLAHFLASDGDEAPHLRWAGWLRRQFRVLRQALTVLDATVLICTLVLIVVVLTSALVLHFGTQKLSLIDAVVRTVSLMATTAGMHEEDYQSPGMKVFVSVLRIVGAALMAAFTAIVTTYLLRARLGGALEASRVPDSGHVVVVGLGPVGFRAVEELVAAEQPVVVIEIDPANRFAATVRRLKVPVIIGDAAVAEVLRQAHAASVRAVIAATNNDMVNLEVALLVRELNPAQRVVLLLSDQQMAQMLRDAADVRQAVSVPALAAPAFVAGLYGDRVQSVFLLRDRLLAVIDLVIQEDDLLTGQAVRAVAVDYRLQPVAVISTTGVPSVHPLGRRLEPHDRLVAITALADLDRLLRRQLPSPNCAVEVLSIPLPARGWLAGLLRTELAIGAEEAERMLDQTPFHLRENVTHGYAEDLLARLVRERVTARIHKMN